jgi:cation diffusion facilitator CzcD-associated flavoprotein CzcO
MSETAEQVDVLVIGAGVTGIYQLYKAREAGFSVKLLEAGGGVGGTWFWNRYPEARFDSESYTYGYLFSKELWDEWNWTEQYAGQPEIEGYFNYVVDRFDLRKDILFNARVASAVFDEAAGRWTVRTENGGELRARYVVAATGVLSVPAGSTTPRAGRGARSTSPASASRRSAPAQAACRSCPRSPTTWRS